MNEEEPAVINLSGNGRTATDPFDLESGLAIFRMTYEGERNFIVRLLDGTGAQPGGVLLANEVGSFKGSKAEQTKAGQYVLDVQASGPWTFAVFWKLYIVSASFQGFVGMTQKYGNFGKSL